MKALGRGLLGLVALMAVAGCQAPPAPSPAIGSSSPTPAPSAAADIRLLPTLTAANMAGLTSWPLRESGYLHISVTATGICASLYQGEARQSLGAFFWPPGYVVRSDRLRWRVVDGSGRFVAGEGDYLYVRGRTASSQSVRFSGLPMPCPAARHKVVQVVAHGAPGVPVGAKKRPAVIVECTEPRVRPNSLVLACADAGLILKHLRYDTWSRHGASGTAMAAVHCYPGSDKVPAVSRSAQLAWFMRCSPCADRIWSTAGNRVPDPGARVGRTAACQHAKCRYRSHGRAGGDRPS